MEQRNARPTVKELDYSSEPVEFGFWNPSHLCRMCRGSAWCWERWKIQAARSSMREQGRRKTSIASLPHVKLAPMSAPGPTGERQEHLDAIISFAGELGRGGVCFGDSTILTIKWATGDLPRRMPIPHQRAAHVLEKKKRTQPRNRSMMMNGSDH